MSTGVTLTKRAANTRAVLVLLFLGLSLSAVATMRVDREPEHLTADDGITRLTADDGVTLLTTGRQQYQLVIGEVRIPLPVLDALEPATR
jgi:hypothetical protein